MCKVYLQGPGVQKEYPKCGKLGKQGERKNVKGWRDVGKCVQKWEMARRDETKKNKTRWGRSTICEIQWQGPNGKKAEERSGEFKKKGEMRGEDVEGEKDVRERERKKEDEMERERRVG